MCFAGTPPTRAYDATSCVTTAPAATNAYSPSVTPHTTVALAPIVAPRRTSVRAYSCLRETWLRGLTTFVNTMDGPQNTSSSRITPSYNDTLFWILQLSPMRTRFITTTFWPRLHRCPITAPDITWLKCHTLVPAPMLAP